jgi:hypothetical protein
VWLPALLGLGLGAAVLAGPPPAAAAGPGSPTATPAISTQAILANAASLLGIRYRWGGTTSTGLDCSAYLSQVWQVPRQTTDTLASVAYPILPEQLQPGDALNLATAADPHHRGHVRLFAGWLDASHTWFWTYEERRPRSIYHAVPWDPRFTPMRRDNYQPANAESLVPAPRPLIPLDPSDPRLPFSWWS